jgi:hypothetical protein
MEKTEGKRQTGRTTRIIDKCIQELFQAGECTIMDHSGQRHSNWMIMDRVVRRLMMEHEISPSMLSINRSKFIIKLKL